MIVIVTSYDQPGMFDTVVRFHGLDEEGGEVTFGVDHRPARDLAEAVARGEDPIVDLEPWQILGAAR